MNLSVSVIIPTYNRKTTLPRALNSVLEQTHPVDEIIVVDDGSTDDTSDWLLNEYPKLQCVRLNHNRGVSVARNVGIAHARSEWIAFLDSDDEWHPSKIQKQIQALEQQPAYLICHANEIWIRNGCRVNSKNKHKFPKTNVFKHALELCLISPSSVLVHRSVFDQLGRFDSKLLACEDYDFWLRVLNQFDVLYLDEPLLNKYGGHTDQLSQKFWGMDRMRIRAIRKLLDNNSLTRENRNDAIVSLMHKCDVLVQGAKKRARQSMAAYYQRLKKQYQSQLGGLSHD